MSFGNLYRNIGMIVHVFLVKQPVRLVGEQREKRRAKNEGRGVGRRRHIFHLPFVALIPNFALLHN